MKPSSQIKAVATATTSTPTRLSSLFSSLPPITQPVPASPCRRLRPPTFMSRLYCSICASPCPSAARLRTSPERPPLLEPPPPPLSLQSRRLRPDPGIRLPAETLGAMIHDFVRKRRIAEAQALVLRLVRRRGASRAEVVAALATSYGRCVVPGSAVFDLLIRTYVQARKPREAAEAFRLLKARGLFVSINACNLLLAGLVRMDWVDMARDIYGGIVEMGMQEADSVFKRMVSRGVQPDGSTYTTLINGHVAVDNLKEAFRLHDEMLQRGFVPDDKF
ncbi:hypothetical protein OPV22_000739 [Ensete ventricosum]|uniref:Pentacotripeptide-repeat region of PRORP domain-containing protein n=1 Tax=Ensete ventricosum TaxID=4639 RepID=A0AAV8QBM4_ENSVE|nr:hypothetical protein OPV22_000739 [Ensete ventricosum]